MLTRPHGAFLSSFFASNPREARGLADPPQIGPVNFPEVGFGASSPIRRVVSHRLQSSGGGRSQDHDRTAKFDPQRKFGVERPSAERDS